MLITVLLATGSLAGSSSLALVQDGANLLLVRGDHAWAPCVATLSLAFKSDDDTTTKANAPTAVGAANATSSAGEGSYHSFLNPSMVRLRGRAIPNGGVMHQHFEIPQKQRTLQQTKSDDAMARRIDSSCPRRLKGDDEAAINLDGMWEFETDALEEGVAVFDRKPRLASQMRVPGAWQAGASGPGVETFLLRHQYSGQAWYRKTVDVSAKPKGATCWLWLGGSPGGVMRSARVYTGQTAEGAEFNSTFVGRHVGYLDPVEMQLPCAGVSTLSISVQVDNRWNVTEDPLWGAGSWWNHPSAGCLPGSGPAPLVNGTATCSGGDGFSFGGYGGIVGHARLLFRQPAWVDDSVHVRSALPTPPGRPTG